MRPSAIAWVGVVASVALLCGCVGQIPEPAKPTEQDATAQVQQMLDATRERFDIAGAPLVAAAIRPKTYERWDAEMKKCLRASGIQDAVGIGWSNEGYELLLEGGTSDSEQNEIMYRCVADDPPDGREMGMLFSDEQREYLWDYYQRWIIPCLASRRVAMLGMPTREYFMAQSDYPWSPYEFVDYDQLPDATSVDRRDSYKVLVQQCGPAHGMIDK